MRTANLESLKRIANRLAEFVAPRDAHYQGSWKRRGGPGAFFTIVRPIDRFEAIAKRSHSDLGTKQINDKVQLSGGSIHAPHDIFAIWEAEDFRGDLYKDGTLSACIQDLACYMLLIIEEMEARKAAVYANTEPGHSHSVEDESGYVIAGTQPTQDEKHAAELKAIRDEYEKRLKQLSQNSAHSLEQQAFLIRKYQEQVAELKRQLNNERTRLTGFEEPSNPGVTNVRPLV